MIPISHLGKPLKRELEARGLSAGRLALDRGVRSSRGMDTMEGRCSIATEPARDKADYPWFWGRDGAGMGFAGSGAFDGNRWNDLHYTDPFRKAARDSAGAGNEQ